LEKLLLWIRKIIMNKFNVGDVVVLKSGGPKMTICESSVTLQNGSSGCRCIWFVNDNLQKLTLFTEDTLELYSNKE